MHLIANGGKRKLAEGPSFIRPIMRSDEMDKTPEERKEDEPLGPACDLDHAAYG